MASTLPEMHLSPTDFRSIIDLVSTHSREIAAKLDDAYHLASFNITFHSGPMCFISKALTQAEAVSVQQWLVRAETSADAADEVRFFGHLVDAWRPVSGNHP